MKKHTTDIRGGSPKSSTVESALPEQMKESDTPTTNEGWDIEVLTTNIDQGIEVLEMKGEFPWSSV